MHRLCLFIVLALVSGLLLFPGGAAAKKKKIVRWYQYAVPFTCGTNTVDTGRMLLGEHASVVRIFNPGGGEATLYSGLAIDFPGGMLIPGWSSDRIATSLPGLSATQASCQDALNLQLAQPAPPFALPDYAQGFALIQSSAPLQIQVSHSVTTATGEVSMASQAIPYRLIAPPGAP